MKLRFQLMLPFLLPGISFLQAQGQDSQQDRHPAFISSLESTRFKQQKIADCDAARSPIQWNGVTLSYSDGLRLTGTDNNGGGWNALIPAGNVLTCEIWTAKLHKGSTGDLIVMNRGQDPEGYNSELTILLFDQQGRPVPWRAFGAFTSTKDGIMQLVKDDSSENASLIIPTREGDKHDGYAYVHQLLTVNQSGVQKVVGTRNSVNWPFITGNKKALASTESKDTLSESIEPSVSEADIITIKGVTPPGKVLGGISLSDGTERMFPAMLVLDSNQRTRSIYFDGDVPDALEKMTDSVYIARFIGQSCEEEECRPLLLVATQQ